MSQVLPIAIFYGKSKRRKKPAISVENHSGANMRGLSLIITMFMPDKMLDAYLHGYNVSQSGLDMQGHCCERRHDANTCRGAIDPRRSEGQLGKMPVEPLVCCL